MAASTTSWEYRTEPDDRADLAALGRDGWELVGIGPTGTLYFKRPGPDFRDRITLAQRAAVEAARLQPEATERP